ncbi:hypothetical protein [Ruegeria sp. Alg231-54]|uniref:hypothetical protein n=1 Tax=Ruegeria sp. Alg231-54 TaxID=1922221 RepID=UPI001F20AFAF|nr:hypothetical protein [Ruegeria sp. Alg231-54]
MDFLSRHISDFHLNYWETLIDDWFFVFAMAFLAFELIRYAVVKKLNWQMMGDTVTNFITLVFFISISFVLLAGFYIGPMSGLRNLPCSIFRQHGLRSSSC